MTTKPPKKARARNSAAKRAAEALAPEPTDADPRRKVVETIDRLREEFSRPLDTEKMSPDEVKRLEAARAIFAEAEADVIALVRAVSERWKPQQSVWATSETAPPLIGDDEYDDLLWVIESINEARILRALGTFAQLPTEMMDDIVHQKLSAKLIPTRIAPQRGGQAVFVRKSQPREEES